MAKFYLTTAIPYVNAKPHIGHVLEFVQCDVIARYHRLIGDDTCLLSGADENAVKNVQAAEAAGKSIQEFVDENTKYFLELAKVFNIKIDVFQRGSDQEKHFPSSQKLWELCAKNGDIYEKEYEGLYCVGCELFYSESELNENGECQFHPGKKIQKVAEKNYFFRLSKYHDEIVKLVSSDAIKITPQERKNEVLGFLKEPLQDISISRTNERAKNWGVPVPGDDSQRMYVWFDALNIYQSGIGFGWDEKLYEKWWPADVHVIGKDITRFHAMYWPAFLLSAGLPLPKQLYIHGFITSEGQKMSKTVGNVIDPFAFVEKYGVDAVRYYLLREIPSGKDGDISDSRFKEVYNADLANGLGNLISRVAKLCQGLTFTKSAKPELSAEYKKELEQFKFDTILASIWSQVHQLDQYMNQEKPWEIKEDPKKLSKILQVAVDHLRQIGQELQPFLPETAEKIIEQFGGETISIQAGYFQRL